MHTLDRLPSHPLPPTSSRHHRRLRFPVGLCAHGDAHLACQVLSDAVQVGSDPIELAQPRAGELSSALDGVGPDLGREATAKRGSVRGLGIETPWPISFPYSLPRRPSSAKNKGMSWRNGLVAGNENFEPKLCVAPNESPLFVSRRLKGDSPLGRRMLSKSSV